MTKDDVSSLVHYKWNCKYHLVIEMENNVSLGFAVSRNV